MPIEKVIQDAEYSNGTTVVFTPRTFMYKGGVVINLDSFNDKLADKFLDNSGGSVEVD